MVEEARGGAGSAGRGLTVPLVKRGEFLVNPSVDKAVRVLCSRLSEADVTEALRSLGDREIVEGQTVVLEDREGRWEVSEHVG